MGDTETELETVNMVSYLPISAERLGAIKRAPREDTKIQSVANSILTGWPENKNDLPTGIQHFHSFQEELSFQDDTVFRGERAAITDALRAAIIRRIHSSHRGVEGCLRRARECVYWQMNENINTFISKCDIGQWTQNSKKRHCTLMIWQADPGPEVGTDLFPFHNKDYLITVDYNSNFWEVDYLPDTKSSTVIRKLKAHFACQGIPDVVVSDNGPQYVSQEFQCFRQIWNFQTFAPGYPQSNGEAEPAVKAAKRLMLMRHT